METVADPGVPGWLFAESQAASVTAAMEAAMIRMMALRTLLSFRKPRVVPGLGISCRDKMS
ncbi:MAG TPA: hypothetical protein VFG12_08505 [Rhodopila sp.]|jgi:hypothetical protein|nr:hypothetical protein [Rhodopila sp.]